MMPGVQASLGVQPGDPHLRITQLMLSKGFGGGERYFVDLALALAEGGHEVQAIVHEKFSDRKLLEGRPRLRVDAVSSLGLWDRLSLRRLVRHVEDFEPEVMHSHMARGAWAGGYVVARGGAPLVATTHNYVDLKYYRYVHTFIPTTRDQARYLAAQGVESARIRRIPNFSMLAPAAEVVRREAASPVRFAAFGRFVRKKGFAVLLDAFALARERGLSNATMAIGGDGPLARALRRRCARLGLDDVVRFDGWIDDVEGYLQQADVFVLPSLDEPFGIVMLEAMASGRPIVTSRTQGPSEVLDEECAYFAEIGDAASLSDALLLVARDEDRARERARAALELYHRRYHRDAVVPQIVDLYQQVAPPA